MDAFSALDFSDPTTWEVIWEAMVRKSFESIAGQPALLQQLKGGHLQGS